MSGLGPFEALEEFAKNGSGLFGEDDGEQQETESSGDEDSTEEEETEETEEEESNDSDEEDLTGIKASRDKALRQKAKLKAALEEANEQLKKLQGEDTRPVDEQIAERDSTISAQGSQIRDLRIQNAFLLDNTHNWHDPRVALRLADLDDVEIDDDGTVSGLKEALKQVAKDHPYLLIEEKKPAKKSGDAQQRTDDKATKAAKRDKLRRKYKI